MKFLVIVISLLSFATQGLAASKLRIVCNRTTTYDDPSSKIQNVFIFEQDSADEIDGSELHHDNFASLFKTGYLPFKVHFFDSSIFPDSVSDRTSKEYSDELLSDRSILRTTEVWEGRRSARQYHIKNPKNEEFDWFQINSNNLDFADFELGTHLDAGWMFCLKPFLVDVEE